jgi:hypothetical protein
MNSADTNLCFNLNYQKQLENTNVSKELFQEYLSKYTKETLTWLFFGIVSIFSSVVIFLASFPLIYIFYYLLTVSSTSKVEITEAFTSTTMRTVGMTGLPESAKVNFLSSLSLELKKSLSIVSSNFTGANFNEAFKSQVVYVSLDALNHDEMNLLCENLKNSKSTFFGGCSNDEKIQTFKGCRTNLEKIFYSESVDPLNISILGFAFLCMSFVHLSIYLGLIIRMIRLHNAVAKDSKEIFEPKGMKMSLKFLPYFRLHFEQSYDHQLMNVVQGEDVIYDQFQDKE